MTNHPHIAVEPVGAPCVDAVCRHCLGRHPATGGMLSRAETDLIHEHRTRLRFGARETICRRGKAPPFFIGNLISGVLKLSFAATPGEVDALLFPGDFLGPFGDSAAVTCTAAALSDCELCCFEGAGLHRVFARHPRLQENFLQHFADAIERARQDAAKLRRPQATARVAALLTIFAERADAERSGNGNGASNDPSGKAPPNKAGKVQLPLRRTEMALLLGLTTETVSRCLSRMRHNGIIRPLSRHSILIKNRPRLEALAED